MLTFFTFDGLDYVLENGEITNTNGELIATVKSDAASEYWIAETSDGEIFVLLHQNAYSELDAAKAIITKVWRVSCPLRTKPAYIWR